jgi:hypothetical protein
MAPLGRARGRQRDHAHANGGHLHFREAQDACARLAAGHAGVSEGWCCVGGVLVCDGVFVVGWCVCVCVLWGLEGDGCVRVWR